MLPASHPLLYACVFRDQTLLAELASSDAASDAAALAAALVAAAPPHHRHLTHTSGGRAHALLLAPPLSLVAVSRSASLPSAHLLLFLRRLRCLVLLRPGPPAPDAEVLRMALALPYDDGGGGGVQREAAEVAAAEEAAAEELRRREVRWRRPVKAVGCGWRRQLRVVLVLDLVLLCMMLAAWVAVCKGFRCIGQR